MSKLEADGIELWFGENRVLSNVHITCETGAITGLLGRNGMGKSCLMQIIYGSLIPRSRSIRFDEERIHDAYKRSDLLLYLPQHPFVPQGFRVDRVFKDYGLSLDEFVTEFPEYEPARRVKMQELSGGGRRLIELWIVLMKPSKFVLLDEPFTHLSPIQLEKAKSMLLMAKHKKGILTTDHMYQHVLDISDKLYVVSSGRTELIESRQRLKDVGYLSQFSDIE